MKNTHDQMEPKEGIEKGPGGWTVHATFEGEVRYVGTFSEPKAAAIALELARIGVVAHSLGKKAADGR